MNEGLLAPQKTPTFGSKERQSELWQEWAKAQLSVGPKDATNFILLKKILFFSQDTLIVKELFVNETQTEDFIKLIIQLINWSSSLLVIKELTINKQYS